MMSSGPYRLLAVLAANNGFSPAECGRLHPSMHQTAKNNSSTTRRALCSVPEMTEMISETCEAHAVYFYPKTGKKC
jgi:hypothetical protein